MEVTDIGNKEEGKVWHRRPGPGQGLLATVVRTVQRAKTVRFLHVAFDATGDSFLAGDHHGNIYVFDIGRNRFRLVQKTGQACTALAFNLRRTTELLVALADHTIKCFDKDTKQMISWMRGHEGAVSFISVHGSGRYAISTSMDTAQLWDLDTFQRKRKLTVRQPVDIQRVFFLPLSNTILSCLSDDSIFAWESDTLSCQYQLPVPDSGSKISYKAFAVSHDGKRLAAGGRSSLIHLWCLDSQQLVRVIQMPTQVRTVRQLEFLPDCFDRGANETLGVLSQEGVLHFINIQTCKLLFHVGSHHNPINTVAISPNGRHVAAIMDNGSINVYSIHSLTQGLPKLPSSQVAIISGGDDDWELPKLKDSDRSDVLRKSAKKSGRQSRAKIFPGFPVDDKENEQAVCLNKKRMVALLKEFGEYPAKYRMFVWGSLLLLPENYTAYSCLTDKGPHSAFLSLQDKYPIKSHRLQRCLQRVVSALAHWAAIFAEVEYLPLIAFPFVKLFQNNPLLCFEVLATFIVNWCQHWFEYFPNPPLNILCMVENVLAHHDKQLLQHLVGCGITSQLYVWPLLETLFSEVLTRDEWLRLFDSVFSNHPSFLLMACVAYLTCCRGPLLHCTQKQDFEYYFHHRNTLDMGMMIREAYRIMDCTPSDIHPRNMLSDFTPLTKGHYPVFNQYPEFIVEYQNREREKIRLQEMERLCEREGSGPHTDFSQGKAEEETFYTHKGEEHRKNILAQEEEKLTQQMEKLSAMKRDLKATERPVLEPSRQRFFKPQQDRGASKIQECEHEIRRLEQVCLDREGDREMKRAGADENGTDLLHSTHANVQALEASLAEVHQLGLQSAFQSEVEERLKWRDAEQKREMAKLTELQRQNLAEEARVAGAMRDVVGREWEEVMDTRAQLQESRRQQASADAVRGRQVVGFPHPPSRTSPAIVGSNAASQFVGTSVMACLNSSSASGSMSTNFSLDRGRAHLDSSERQLLREVRELRQRLACRAREDSCASSQSLHKPLSHSHI